MKDTKNAFTPVRDATPALRQTVAGRDPGKRRLAIRLVRYRDATPGDTATNYDAKPCRKNRHDTGISPCPASSYARKPHVPDIYGTFVTPPPDPYPTANTAAALTRQQGFIQYPDISVAPACRNPGEAGHPRANTAHARRQATAP